MRDKPMTPARIAAALLLVLAPASLSGCVIAPAPAPGPRGAAWVPGHYHGWHWVPGHWA